MGLIQKCPKCESIHFVKNGRVKGRQRYLCNRCGYHFTVDKMGKRIEKEYVVKAIQMYLEGMGLRDIERYLGVSHNSVRNWVRKFGQPMDEIRKPCSEVEVIVEVIEVEKLSEYAKDKIDSGLLLIGVGNKFLAFTSKEPQ